MILPEFLFCSIMWSVHVESDRVLLTEEFLLDSIGGWESQRKSPTYRGFGTIDVTNKDCLMFVRAIYNE